MMISAAPVGIVGMSCLLPGADSPGALRELLLDGEDAVRPTPDTHRDKRNYYSPNPGIPDQSDARHVGFLEDVRGFDADVLGISGREAYRTASRQRRLGKGTWEALAGVCSLAPIEETRKKFPTINAALVIPTGKTDAGMARLSLAGDTAAAVRTTALFRIKSLKSSILTRPAPSTP